jgi:hypothetical protein
VSLGAHMYEGKLFGGRMDEEHVDNDMDCFVLMIVVKVVNAFVSATRKEVETSVTLVKAEKITNRGGVIV